MSDHADFQFMSSQICSYGFDEFLSVCHDAFVGLIFCDFGVFL